MIKMEILAWIYLVTLFLHYADANICPNEAIVTPGESLLLDCNNRIISSFPTVYTWTFLSGANPTLDWAWDEIVIHETETGTGTFSYPNEEMYSRKKFQYNRYSHDLTIMNATNADQGCYKCAAVAGSTTITTAINVSVRELTTKQQETTEAESGGACSMMYSYIWLGFLLIFTCMIISDPLM